MACIQIIDRRTGKESFEKVFGERALAFLYKDNFVSKLCLFLVSKNSILSRVYGFFQRTKISRKKIASFIKEFEIDADEFEKKIEDFDSFNDFFIRHLKKEARPIASGENIAILPSDARYLVFPTVSLFNSFYVKNESFNLRTFLQDDLLAERYSAGSMVIARLCPADYHRFHFPCGCIPGRAELINGYLYSVNPVALKKNMNIFSQNKRMITRLKTNNFGEILFVEVGATNVGTIHQSYIPEKHYDKGAEKGYFSFGGSTIVLLFEENKIRFANDLLANSQKKIETKASFGEILGVASHSLI